MTGLGVMLRFTARRERVRIPVYVIVLAALIASTAAQSEQLYPTAAARADYVATVEGNPGLIAMVGPPLRSRTSAATWRGSGARSAPSWRR